jgi:hypothetical protein
MKSGNRVESKVTRRDKGGRPGLAVAAAEIGGQVGLLAPGSVE